MAQPPSSPDTHDPMMQDAVPSRPASTMDELLRRIRGEFLEMPGLRLTEAQARRLWDLDANVCAWLLKTLIDAKFLFRTGDGNLMRVDHAWPVRATLGRRGRRRVA